MKTSFGLIVFCICVFSTGIFANEIFAHRAEPKTGYVINGNAEDEALERMTNKIEVLKFTPKFSYLESGDIHCVVDFFIQYRQASSNFYDYGFARNPENHKLEMLKMHFLDADEYEILSVSCVNDGQDMIWDMEGVRIVQLYGSFIMTYGRCDYLNGSVLKIAMSDKHGNLLDDVGNRIVYDLSKDDINALTTNMILKMRQNAR